jgi:hypothetical protein
MGGIAGRFSFLSEVEAYQRGRLAAARESESPCSRLLDSGDFVNPCLFSDFSIGNLGSFNAVLGLVKLANFRQIRKIPL